jgi:hypothetical protein
MKEKLIRLLRVHMIIECLYASLTMTIEKTVLRTFYQSRIEPLSQCPIFRARVEQFSSSLIRARYHAKAFDKARRVDV